MDENPYATPQAELVSPSELASPALEEDSRFGDRELQVYLWGHTGVVLLAGLSMAIYSWSGMQVGVLESASFALYVLVTLTIIPCIMVCGAVIFLSLIYTRWRCLLLGALDAGVISIQFLLLLWAA